FSYSMSLRNSLKPGSYGRAGQLYAAGAVTAALPSQFALAGGQPSLTQNFVLAGNAISRTWQLQTASGGASALVSIGNTANATLYEGPPTTNQVGPLTYSQGLPLTIDNDKPSATATGTQYAQPGASTVLGGIAQDPSSYITAVEVSVDNGPWQAA